MVTTSHLIPKTQQANQLLRWLIPDKMGGTIFPEGNFVIFLPLETIKMMVNLQEDVIT